MKSTAFTIALSWKAGDVSSTFARTAFDRTFRLIEQERATLAASAASVSLPGFAEAIADTEVTARTVAALAADVERRDRVALSRHMAALGTAEGAGA